MARGRMLLCALTTFFALVTTSAWANPFAPPSGGTLDQRDIRPFMMLVVDTSGSMERLPTCSCTTPSCNECLPTCGSASDEKNRWAVTLEALTGTIQGFSCESLPRVAANGATYDLGYYLPYHQPWDCSSGGPACKMFPSSGTSTANFTQASDGIIDAYRGRVRFGLMTFDGWDTYLGEGRLVPVAQYSPTSAASESGLWSYGSYTTSGTVITRTDGSIPGRFHYPNCTTDYQMDTGARGPQATEGTLVSLNSCPSLLCNNTDAVTLNDQIQQALIDTRPYGGTPIAGSLDDLYYHLTNDVADLYGTCRDRYALLITDGLPDDDYRAYGCDCTQNGDPTAPGYCGGGAGNDPSVMKCPYPKPEEVAYDLITGRSGTDVMGNAVQDNPPLKKLIVVGLSITDSAVKDRLNLIAEQGGSDPYDLAGETNYALFADDLSALKVTLDAVVASTLSPISRTVPAFVTAAPGANAAQYQFSAGFQLPTDVGEPYTGILERKRFTCSGPADGEPLTNADRFQVGLNSQSRTLYSVVPAGSGSSPEDHLFWGLGSPCGALGTTGCVLEEINDAGTFTAALLGLTGAGAETERQDTVNWMYGAGALSTGVNPRVNKKLGDIYHSSPQIVTGPQFDRADAAYNAFRQLPLDPTAPTGARVSDRPPVVYVSTNDGILHAFLVDDFTSSSGVTTSGGTELWGFVPPMHLDQISKNLTQNLPLLDATPAVRDVYFRRTSDGTQSDGSEYHTVLVAGMRGGGNGYIALDVTNPFKPKFLWQFTDPDMGLTYGVPALGQAIFKFDDGVSQTVQDRAIAILPGGQGTLGGLTDPGCIAGALGLPEGTALPNPSAGGAAYGTQASLTNATQLSHRTRVRCWQQQGRALFIVDVETGRLIKRIGPNVFPSPLVGSPALYNAEVGTLASRAFIHDADGVLWRLDLTNPGSASGAQFDPVPNDETSGWTARPFHDLFHGMGHDQGEVSYETPIITTDPQGRLVIITATGDTDNFDKPSAENRAVSLTENVLNDPPTSVDDYVAAFNWEHRDNGSYPGGLVTSELVTGRMVLTEGQLFYASFISVGAGGACAAGKGRLWSVDYRLPDTNRPNTGSPATYQPLYIPVTDTAGTANPLFNISDTAAADNLLVMGLGLTDRPSCETVSPVSDSPFGAAAGYGQFSTTTPAKPTRYVVAQASGGTDATKLGGSALTSIEQEVQPRAARARVTAWSANVD